MGGLLGGLLGRLFGRLRSRLWPDVGNLDNTCNFRSIGQKPLRYLGDRRVGVEVLNCLSQCPVLSGCYSYDCAYQLAQNCVNGGSTSITSRYLLAHALTHSYQCILRKIKRLLFWIFSKITLKFKHQSQKYLRENCEFDSEHYFSYKYFLYYSPITKILPNLSGCFWFTSMNWLWYVRIHW